MITDNENYTKYAQKLMDAGIAKRIAYNKTARTAFAVCSENPDLFKMATLENEIERDESTLKMLRTNIEAAKKELKKIEAQTDGLQKVARKFPGITRASEIYKKNEELIDSFNKSLQECETEEGRDTMRKAQLFVNSVDVNTDQNNTVFINGLACILSDGKCGSLFDGFKKPQRGEQG